MTLKIIVFISFLAKVRTQSYNSIVEMAEKYFSFEGQNFYEKDFLAYGCFCNYQFDQRPTGFPVDDLDRSCLRHRQCYECAEKEKGTIFISFLKPPTRPKRL